MATVRGCYIPEDLYYDVERNTWLRRERDGTATVGLTAYACLLAGRFVACSPQPPGRTIRKDKACATVESGKWVGPARSPVGGEVVAVNEALQHNPGLINDDPYGDGWLVRLRPTDWAADRAGLVTGAEALREFEVKMEADGFEGF